MPICYKIDKENFKLGLWNLVENDFELFDRFILIAPQNEIVQAQKFKNPSRRSEWVVCRLLLYKLLDKVVEIEYDNNGKPEFVDHHWRVSISHTKGMVAVTVSENNTGIDIELINDRVLKIEDRFLSIPEKENINAENRLLPVLINWSAKETIYKIYGKKGVDFKRDIFIESVIPNSEGQFKGELRIQNRNTLYNLNYFIFENAEKKCAYVIVFHHS